MKKFLISIIIILILVLIGQIIYFNTNNKKVNTNTTQNTLIENKNVDEKHYVSKPIAEDIIIPNKIDAVSRKYKGDLKILTLQKELYKFVNTNVKKIYNEVTGKSKNKVLQIYDLKKQEINDMSIYSAEDFSGISAQTLKVGGIENIKYSYSNIDMDTYKEDENGYTTFNITFIYSNSSEIKVKVYMANSSTNQPNIKFGKPEEKGN